MDDMEISSRLNEMESKRELLGIEFMMASTPEEVELVKSEITKLEYEIKELRNKYSLPED